MASSEFCANLYCVLIALLTTAADDLIYTLQTLHSHAGVFSLAD